MQMLTGSRSFVNQLVYVYMILSGLARIYANFAGFDQDLNVSLESKFFPKIEKSQTVENENRQHELSIAIVKME